MNASVLRHALGRLCVDAPDGLYAAPTSARELAEILAVVKAHGAALHREVKLSRAAFDRLEAVEPKSGTAHAGAGIVLGELERRLAAQSLSLGALSPGAMKLTLGEFLEGPYAGLTAVPVGRLDTLCIAVDAVLADGRHLKTHFSPRSAAGPDLAALLLGAHGRTGLVLSARLRCLPRPEARHHARYSFPSVETALDALRAVLADGCIPDRARLQSVAQRAVVELELSGPLDLVQRDLKSLQHRAPALGGRAAGEPLQPPAHLAEHECSWSAVGRAVEHGEAVDLYRLSLHGAVVVGDAGGLALGAPARWAHATTLSALAPQVLGGPP